MNTVVGEGYVYIHIIVVQNKIFMIKFYGIMFSFGGPEEEEVIVTISFQIGRYQWAKYIMYYFKLLYYCSLTLESFYFVESFVLEV